MTLTVIHDLLDLKKKNFHDKFYLIKYFKDRYIQKKNYILSKNAHDVLSFY